MNLLLEEKQNMARDPRHREATKRSARLTFFMISGTLGAEGR